MSDPRDSLIAKMAEALAMCAIPLEVLAGQIVENGPYGEITHELQQLIVDEAIPKLREALSSDAAQAALAEREALLRKAEVVDWLDAQPNAVTVQIMDYPKADSVPAFSAQVRAAMKSEKPG